MIKSILLCTIIVFQYIHADMQSGHMYQEIASEQGRVDIVKMNFATDVLPYVSGGLTFTYPTGLFSTAPRVQITIERAFSLLSATAFITSNSATSTTVRVVLGSLLSILEAATGTVTVYLLATGK